MAERRRPDGTGASSRRGEIVARLAKAAGEVPEPSPERVEQIRERLMQEVRTRRGRARLGNEALDSVVALLLRSQRD